MAKIIDNIFDRRTVYELRHRFPRRMSIARLLVESDQEALHVAYELANVAPVEVWRDGIFIGEVQRPVSKLSEGRVLH